MHRWIIFNPIPFAIIVGLLSGVVFMSIGFILGLWLRPRIGEKIIPAILGQRRKARRIRNEGYKKAEEMEAAVSACRALLRETGLRIDEIMRGTK